MEMEMEMEEDQSISRAKDISDESLDLITQKKQAAMLERLSNLQQSRLQQSISRKTDNSSPLESTKSFLDRFSEAKRSIQDELDRCRLVSDPKSKGRLKLDLEQVSMSIAELEKLVSENSYFLPSYEIRSSLKTISELKESLENANSMLLPKKKFAFKNKAAKKDHNNATSTDEIRASDSVSTGSKASETILPAKLNIQIRDSPGFRNREDAVLVKNFRSSEEGDFTLSDLNSCEVRLTGSLRALFIHRLRSCRVFVGPVLGSVLIEEVEDCLFMLASHQIRIHHARNTDFYLRVRSRPIIEDSSSVRFAPYHLSYEGLDRDLQDSGLDEDTGNWANVDDFKWLRAVQSPNWSILPEDERVSIVKISSVETCVEDC